MAQSFNLKDTGSLSWNAAGTKITGLAGGGLSVSAGTSIYFDTGGNDRMMIDNQGYVGIGTNEPSEKLEVAGSAKGDGAVIGNAKIGVWGYSVGEYAVFLHKNMQSTELTSYALIQKDDGNTHLNAASGQTLDFRINNSVKMKINGTTGYVGIGDVDPQNILHIKGPTGGTNKCLFTNVGCRADTTPAKTFLQTYGTASQYSILGPLAFTSSSTSDLVHYAKSVHGTTEFYYEYWNSGTTMFTGQHSSYSGVPDIKTNSNLNNYTGLIVCSLGIYSTDNTDEYIAGISVNNAWPVFKLTNNDNNKSVYGVITNKTNISASCENDNVDTGFSNWLDGKIRINSVGEGAIWICNKNGSFENGYYISSTTITGYGGKQSDDLLHNYTVAKITCDCNFDLTKVVKQKVKLIDDPTGKVISFDSQGNIEYEDILDPDGNIQMVYQYQTRFLQADGTLLVDEDDYETRLNNGETVYIACFVGCTYHCG